MTFGWLACLPFVPRPRDIQSSEHSITLSPQSSPSCSRQSSLPQSDESAVSKLHESCLTPGQEQDTAAWEGRIAGPVELPSFSPSFSPTVTWAWQDKLPGLDNDFRPESRAVTTFTMPMRAYEQAHTALEEAIKPNSILPYAPQPLNVDLHRDFDLAFRDAYHRGRANGVAFAYQPHHAGLCTGVPRAIDSIAEVAQSNFSGQADFETYVQTCGLHGCHARVQWPDDYGWFQGPRQRIPGTPAFRLDTCNPYHWRWIAVPGTEAGPNAWAEGTYHAVAARTPPLAPSDPTIEQFQKHQDVILYLVDSS